MAEDGQATPRTVPGNLRAGEVGGGVWAGTGARRVAGGDTTWLVVFTDLSMLLLAFFVMLFAMSEPNSGDWQRLVSAMSQQPSPQPDSPDVVGPSRDYTIDVAPSQRGLEPGYLENVLTSLARDDPALARVRLTRLRDRLVISLPADMLFDTLSTELKGASDPVLTRLADVLAGVENRIEVRGHTDPRPVRAQDAPVRDNWELSLRRAQSVAQALTEAGLPGEIIPYGFAAGRTGMVPAELSQRERYARMRRVDVVVRAEATP